MAIIKAPLPSFGAIILAGGLGRRMNYQQKGLMLLNQRPLVAHMLEKLSPYTQNIVISANKELANYAVYNFPVVEDLADYALRGPLAGLYSAMMNFANDIEYIQILPCDTPYIPDDLVLDFYNYLKANPKKEMVIASTPNKKHPVIMQCRRSVIAKLQNYLDDPRELNRVMSFIKRCDYGVIMYRDSDKFKNINEPGLLKD